MSHGLKTILHSSRAVRLEWWANDYSCGVFDFARVLHIRHVSAYSGKWTATMLPLHCEIMGAGCIFIGVVLFCQPVQNILLKITFFFCGRFSFMFGALLHTKISEQASVPIFMLIFRCLVIIITFCCLPTLPRIIPRQVSKIKQIRGNLLGSD